MTYATIASARQPKARKPSTLVAVDVSPRYLNAHTLLERCPEEEQVQMARAHERIASLMFYAEQELGIPVIVVESSQLERVSLHDRKRGRVGVCGVYGDDCVIEVATKLKERGFDVVLLEDACLWESAPGGDAEMVRRDARFARVPRARALELYPDLAEGGRGTGEWSGGIPAFFEAEAEDTAEAVQAA